MISDYYGPQADRPGIRLHRVEVYNWGTFDSTDGSVYIAKTEGRTTLLVGRNGAGKSTLVDAVLTLLVPNAIRNYNVAAGAKKTERTERTYVLGACDQQLAADDAVVRKRYLRSGAQFYSIILAHFYDEQAQSGFTLVQILYPKADGSIEKVFAFGEGDKSIANDLHGLSKAEGLIGTLKTRGFKATKTFTEYHQWFVRRTRVKTLAMDVFNHTVAVKDIRSLNAFIRDHMLENSGGKDRVQKLIDHFAELRAAHRQLVRIRTQHDLLVPIENHGKQYLGYEQELIEAEKLSLATDAFFTQQTLKIVTPLVVQHREEMANKEVERDSVAVKIKQAAQEARLLENEIDQVGGDRVRQIPQLIELESAHREHKEKRRAVYVDSANQLQLAKQDRALLKELQSPKEFAELKQAINERRYLIGDQLAAISADRDQLVAQRSPLKKQQRELESELETLAKRRNNLPSNFSRMRAEICSQLGVNEKDLPFAAELMAVGEDHLPWESSIEMVLRGLALSLLVPDHLYRKVSAYIEKHRLVDNGYGQKLVYQRVGTSEPANTGDRWHDQALLRKLQLRDDHELTPWLTNLIESRFNYRCCDSIDEFHHTRGLALTQNRHVKAGESRHEKDDRDKSSDPSRYVLGWNNVAKKRRLAESIEGLRTQIDDLSRKIDSMEDQRQAIAAESNAIDRCLQVAAFDEIDSTGHLRTIDSLKAELEQLLKSNDKIGVLKSKLVEVQKNVDGLNVYRDEVVSRIGELKRQIADGERLIANARSKMVKMQADGSWDDVQAVFGKIEESLQGQSLCLENLGEHEKAFRSEQDRSTLR